MWILTGPFDCEEHDIGKRTTSKLLKAGVKYILGRKEDAASLVIRKKNISRHHFEISVANDPQADWMDPSYRPTLTITNMVMDSKKPVARRMDRADGQLAATLNPGEIVEVDEGNVIHVVLDVYMTANWVQVACLSPPTRGIPSPDPAACSLLGICVRPTYHPGITHHLTSCVTLSPELALSLVSVVSLVTPSWLGDLLESGHAKPGELSALEEQFVLPSTDKYRPAISQTLPPFLKEPGKWAPNEARAAMFAGYRFIFVGEKGREVQEAMRELVKRGLGEYECVAVDGGRTALRRVLAKGRAKGRIMVLVGEEGALVPAIGRDGWCQLVDEARSFDINFTSRERILEAVVHADALLLSADAALSAGPSVQEEFSPLPDVVLNTHADEPSIPAPTIGQVAEFRTPTCSKLRRRAPSRASSRVSPLPHAASSPVLSTYEAPSAEQPRRKGLIRRAGRWRADDLLADVDEDGAPAASSQLSAEPACAPSIGTEPTSGRGRLKRRAGTHTTKSDIIDLTSDVPLRETDEPPLKKFRALFEESDPTRLTQTQMDSMTESEPPGATQGRESARLGAATQFTVVAEEEEESAGMITQAVGTLGQGVKRKVRTVEEELKLTDAANKRRAIEGANAVEPYQTQNQPGALSRTASKAPSVVNRGQKEHKPAGAAPNKPDKDEAFLKAVASTKKGKRAEDTFDREFNNLRISKPEGERTGERDVWAVLNDFEDDRDLRGNFMVVVEMEVQDRPRKLALVRGEEERADWVGRPDFKKFKKKSAARRGPVVEIYAENDNSYDMSLQLWKGSQIRSQTVIQSQPHSQDSQKPQSAAKRRSGTQTQTQRTQARANAVVLDDDSDDEAVLPSPAQIQSQKMGSSRAGSVLPRAKAPKTQPLFIESDDEAMVRSQTMADGDDDHIEEADVAEGEVPALRSAVKKTTRRALRPTKKADTLKHSAPVILDDDSDDEAAFVGFATRIAAGKK